MTTTASQPLKVTIVVATAVVAVGIVFVLLGTTILGGNGDSVLPACDTLPDVAAVDRALTDRSDLRSQLERISPDVTVSRSQPCDDTSRAAIEVTYTGGDQRDAIEEVLTQQGFGVPVQVVAR